MMTEAQDVDAEGMIVLSDKPGFGVELDEKRAHGDADRVRAGRGPFPLRERVGLRVSEGSGEGAPRLAGRANHRPPPHPPSGGAGGYPPSGEKVARLHCRAFMSRKSSSQVSPMRSFPKEWCFSSATFRNPAFS